SDGKVTTIGTTEFSSNEFADEISCGSSYLDFDAPQLYYRVHLKAGTTYRVAMLPESHTNLDLYAFPASSACLAAAINSSCEDHLSKDTGSGQIETIDISPLKDEDWVIAIDSSFPTDQGAFELSIIAL
ncbi:MAG: hypothetical protein JRH20_13125, partial [Deltaproteobacteria bacterium]|nr:hypothetical protein [Deltaproteobacteria bacterium]